MINVEIFKNNLPKYLKNPSVVAPDVLRCEEKDDQGRLFALHYFAMAPDLTKAADGLGNFQDQVLGGTYYETPGDLRWNHYLYFITDENILTSPEGIREKAKIESDRSYARKFVLTNQQFIDALQQRELAVSAAETKAAGDVLSRWTSRLMNEKLDIVLEQKGLAESVRVIGEGHQVKRTRSATVKRTQGVHSLAKGFISKIEIRRFRDYLVDRTFDNLGSVNLIVGSNGTGKTSILEAIEYLFCGDNARISPTQRADIRGYIQSEEVPVDASVAIDELKSRNLTWYGIKDLRGSSLANSFARYNFLSTDEAALLAENPDVDFDDLLSKVVAGPQAADLWSHITKLADPIETEISKTKTRLLKWAAEKRTAQEQIANASASPNQADHAFLVLSEDLRRLEWKNQFTKQSIEVAVLPDLQRLYSLIREILDADWAEGAVVPRIIRKQREEAKNRITILRNLANEISAEKRKILGTESTLQDRLKKLSLLDEIRNTVASGVFDVIRSIEEEERKLADDKKLATSAPLLNSFQDLSKADLSEDSIDEAFNKVIERERQLSDQIQATKSSLEALQLTKANNEVLLQDIRRLAKRLAESQHDMKHCPVCRSEFDAIELRHRIEESVESTANKALEIVAARLNLLMTEQTQCKARRALLGDASRYAELRNLDTTSIRFDHVLKDISEVQGKISSAEERLERSRKQLEALAEAGFSKVQVQALITRAKTSGIDISAQPDLSAAKLTIDQERKVLEKRLSEEKRALEELKRKFLTASQSATEITSENPEERMLSIAEQRCAAIDQAIENLDYIKEFIKIDENASLTTVSAPMGSAVSAAEKYIAASSNEQRLGGIEQKAREQLIEIEASIRSDDGKLKQLQHAHNVLNEIRTNDSLAKATENELNAVCQVTAAIFGNVHSPREFGVQRGLHQPLFRLDTRKAVSLKEISCSSSDLIVQ
ncbi:MAG: AAA family ATPase [Burkholderiales bacterium]|nr:AAA family ATPase [Burkholderiales bacterium]